MDYKDLEEKSWSCVRSFMEQGMPSPISVHVPINLPLAKELIYCDKAFNVYALPVPRGMRTGAAETAALREAMRILLVSFAFGEPGFVPDFRLAKARRKPGCPGEIEVSYFAWQLLYRMECCTDAGSNAWIRMTVQNMGQVAKVAHVRARLAKPREQAVFAYHYVPFAWDASNWIDDDSISFRDNAFYDDRGLRGKVLNCGGDQEYEAHRSFAPEDYNAKEFNCENPYWVQHDFRLKEVSNTLHVSAELEPGQSCSFELVMRPEEGGDMAADYEMAAAQNRAVWQGITAGLTQVDFGDKTENARFEAIRNCNLQLLLDRGEQLQPSQGGSSERFFVWVWEALNELRAMVRLGCFDTVRRVLEMLLSLQDSGVPPQGEFTTTEGAIGTTGPRWTNSTGSALMLASEYLLLSGDCEFWKRHGKNLIRAAQWILGQVKATQVPGALNYGLMPKACATDGDVGYIYVTTDGFSWAGVAQLCKVIKAFGCEEYPVMAAQAEEYRKNIYAAMKRVSREDGFIDRKLNEDGKICYGFRNICSAMQLVECGCCSALEPQIGKLIGYQETHCFKGPFCAPMSYDLNYVGNAEKTMMECYVRRGEYKKAWLAGQTFRRYAMTSDLYLTQERYCESDLAETCWQPNASNNGRFLEMALECLYYDCGETIYLLGGVAPFEFDDRGHFSIRNLHTAQGLVNLEIHEKHLRLDWERPLQKGTTIVFPDWLENPAVTLAEPSACLDVMLVPKA